MYVHIFAQRGLLFNLKPGIKIFQPKWEIHNFFTKLKILMLWLFKEGSRVGLTQ